MDGSARTAAVSRDQLDRDRAYIESLWKPQSVQGRIVPVIDRGEGPPVVMVPVASETELIYTPQLQALEQGFRTILYRRRESTRTRIGLDERVEELRSLLDHLHVERVHLLAHSDGAMVSLAFAARYPARVCSLVAMAVPDRYRIPPHPLMRGYITLLDRWPLDRLTPDWLLQWLLSLYGTGESGVRSSDLFALIRAYFPRPFSSFFKCSMAPLLVDYDGRQLAPRVLCPTLLLDHATGDRILRRGQMAALARLLPNCRGLITVPDGGHLFPYTQPALVNPAIRDFYAALHQVQADPLGVVDLADLVALDGELVGRKASGLARLRQSGMTVPDGFCVTTAALAGWGAEQGLSSACWEQVLTAYRRLCAGRPSVQVAIRSSSTLEDMSGHSFAGQYETILGVQNEAELAQGIERCLASYWSARAVAYRRQAGLEDGRIHMGILVQEMVAPTSAGVLFTIDPCTSPWEEPAMAVNAVWGLGEALVSGLVTPDAYRLHRQSGRVLTARIGDKRHMLTARQLAALAAVGRTLEQMYGGAQDVEWCFAQDRLFLLQVRPITTLRQTWQHDSRYRGYWLRWGALVEWGRTPLSPMTISLLDGLRLDRAVAPLGLFLRHPSWMVRDGYLYSPLGLRWTLGWLLTPWRLWRAYTRLHRQFDALVADYQAQIEPWLRSDLRAMTTHQLLQAIDELAAACRGAFARMILSYYPICLISERLFRRTYRWVTGDADPQGAADLLTGLENRSLQTDGRFWALAQALRQNPILMEAALREEITPEEMAGLPGGDEFMQRLNDVLATAGHQLQDIDLTCPTASDDPIGCLRLLRSFLRAEHTGARASLEQRAARRERRLAAVRERLRQSHVRRGIFESMYGLACRYSLIREDRPFYLGLGWRRLREVLLEVGARLTQQGTIDAPTDLFFMTRTELTAAAEEGIALHREVTDRRLAWERQKGAPAPSEINPPFLRRQLARWLARLARMRTDALLVGAPGSPGIAKGPVRLVREMADFAAVQPGDVVVAPATTPAWTLLFGMAAAVVTDVGGALSHAAIVAREYGIPAVLGTGAATHLLRDGQIVIVDGDQGQVRADKGVGG